MRPTASSLGCLLICRSYSFIAALLAMSLRVDDTIAAIATASAGAYRGVVRISGPAALRCSESLFEAERPADSSPTAPTARVLEGHLMLAGGARLPAAAYMWPTARSYTRQPTVELHTVGSPPLLAAVLAAVCQAGARLAQPGEFTLRAFLAGRLDLTQAEAVLGVIDARDAGQLAISLRQLAGGLARPLSQLREDLLSVLAHLEAGLDFVEEDIEFIDQAALVEQLGRCRHEIESLAERMTGRERAEGPPRVVLLGRPNVGKSSLLNALAGGERAITSPQAGATRDYTTATLGLGQIQAELVDTAGVDELSSDEGIESQAQRLSREQHESADLRLLCLDATRPLDDWERRVLQADLGDLPLLPVLTKCDAAAGRRRPVELPNHTLPTSVVTGEGIDTLRREIERRLLAGDSAEAAPATAARCRDSLHRAGEHLRAAIELAQAAGGEELIAAEIRNSLEELGRVVGAVYTDDILDRIFSRFCIGK